MMAAEHDAMDQAKSRRSYRSEEELAMRVAVDKWGRARWPSARVVHELVMDRGNVRADMAFVSPDHLVSVEIKSVWDTHDRLMNQVGMFRLATPETWIVVATEHLRSAELMHYLLPSVGVATARRVRFDEGFRIEVVHEATRWAPHPEALLSLLWVAELEREAVAARVWQGKNPSHKRLVAAMLKLSPVEQIASVCRQLRGRDALWRADQSVTAEAPQQQDEMALGSADRVAIMEREEELEAEQSRRVLAEVDHAHPR